MKYCRNLWVLLVVGMKILRAPIGTSAADNPCPDVLKYEGHSGSEHGIITVPNTYPYIVVNISITVYIAAGVRLTITTKVEQADAHVLSRLKDFCLEPVWYRLEVPVSSPLPKIKSISANGQVICNGTVPADAGCLTALTFEHVRFNSKCGSASLKSPFNIQQCSSGGQQHLPLLTLPPQCSSNENQCGTIAINIPLIIGGEDTVPGQWPWHVVLYVKIKRQIKFCGGTLVGTRTIITAAHCVTNEGRKLRTEDITVYLGRYNLRNKDEEGLQYRAVSNIEVHPSYRHTSYVGDIAVLNLSTSVEVTDFVRPVCLWGQDNSNPADVINEEGQVAGWGLNERDVPTDKLMMVKMPVVSHQTCNWGNPTYLHITSSGSFCAGYRNGSSACRGDSGGGMVFARKLNDGTKVLMLRGIVSVGRGRGGSCDTNSYVVFTDVAEYLDWIYNKLM